MAAYRTSTTTWNTSSGSKAAAVACVPGDFLVAFVSHQVNTASHAVTENGGGTWTEAVANTNDAINTGRQSVWVRNTSVTSTATITVTTAPGASSGGGLTVYAISGMTRFGKAAIRSSGTQSTLAAGTPAPVLSLTPLTTSVILAFVQTQTNGSANCVPRSSPAYSERHDQGYNTPTSGLETSSINSGETSATITHGGATPSGFSSMAIELDATDPSSVTRHPLFPHGPRRMPVMGPKVLLRQQFPAAPDAVAGQTVTADAALSATPTMPNGSVNHRLTGIVLTETPTLPNGALQHRLTGIVLTTVPTMPNGSLTHRLTGIVLTETPSLPNGSLQHRVTGIVLTEVPTLPNGSLTHYLTGVVLTTVPTLPDGSAGAAPVYVTADAALTASPSLPNGSLQHRLTGIVLTESPSLPNGALRSNVTGVVLSETPTLPNGALQHRLTGVVLTTVPTLPDAAVGTFDFVTGDVLTVTPSLPDGQVNHAINGVVLTVEPEFPVGIVQSVAVEGMSGSDFVYTKPEAASQEVQARTLTIDVVLPAGALFLRPSQQQSDEDALMALL